MTANQASINAAEAARAGGHGGSEWQQFCTAIGFGDGVTGPLATPKEVADRWHELFVAASDHFERCPAWCDDCEQWERPRSCTVCKGSGCGPGTALGAYDPCRECGGDATDHQAYKPTPIPVDPSLTPDQAQDELG